MTAATVLPVRHQWRDALVFCTDDRIDVYGLAVATALHVHMDASGRCRVGLRRLAGLARCSVNTVRARLGVLVDAGWLRVEGGDRERATYAAVIPGDDTPDAPVEAPAERPVEAPAERPVEAPRAVSPERRAVSPHGASCVTGRHTYPMNPMNPARRSSSKGWHDPSLRRPPPDRPPVEPGEVVERDDGTLWVRL